MNDDNPTIKIDPAFAAKHHIEQALINFYKLGLQKSAAIWKFEDHQNSDKPHMPRYVKRIVLCPPSTLSSRARSPNPLLLI